VANRLLQRPIFSVESKNVPGEREISAFVVAINIWFIVGRRLQ